MEEVQELRSRFWFKVEADETTDWVSLLLFLSFLHTYFEVIWAVCRFTRSPIVLPFMKHVDRILQNIQQKNTT